MTREQTPFRTAAETDDPLEREHLHHALEREGIPVMVQDRWGDAAAPLTDGLTRPWWRLSVPAPELPRALSVVASEREALATHEAEDVRAAEEEATAPQGEGSRTSNNA